MRHESTRLRYCLNSAGYEKYWVAFKGAIGAYSLPLADFLVTGESVTDQYISFCASNLVMHFTQQNLK